MSDLLWTTATHGTARTQIMGRNTIMAVLKYKKQMAHMADSHKENKQKTARNTHVIQRLQGHFMHRKIFCDNLYKETKQRVDNSQTGQSFGEGRPSWQHNTGHGLSHAGVHHGQPTAAGQQSTDRVTLRYQHKVLSQNLVDHLLQIICVHGRVRLEESLHSLQQTAVH